MINIVMLVISLTLTIFASRKAANLKELNQILTAINELSEIEINYYRNKYEEFYVDSKVMHRTSFNTDYVEVMRIEEEIRKDFENEDRNHRFQNEYYKERDRWI